MSHIELDYLPKHSEIQIYQDRDMFCINTDTTLLGEFLTIHKSDSVLDIGTNNGALLLYANLNHPSQLTGIDINKEGLKIAKMNMELHKLNNAILINEDAKKFYNEKGYDVIICNPPFFNTKDEKLKNENTLIKNARHEDTLSVEDMFACFKRNLKDNGSFFIMHRYNRLNDVLETMFKYGFRITRIQPVYDQDRNEGLGFLLQGKRSKSCESHIDLPKYVER